MIIDRGESEVDNHFRRLNILTITLSGMYYLVYYTDFFSGKKRYVNGAGEEECGFLGETKRFAKTAQMWFQNVRLDLIKKTNTHT